MGGKKKKGAFASPAVPRSSVPATGNRAAPDAADKKPQQRPNSSKAPTKENKIKGLADTSGVSDKSILKVVIQPDLEKKVIRLINDHRQGYGDKGPVSGRLTTKKLLDLYTALQKFHFKTEHIEEAMKSSVLYGGDLHSALDWLCLNLRDDELPEGFSQSMCEENTKSRPRFQEKRLEKSQEAVVTENDRYLVLTAQLYDAKEMAADAKAKKDKPGQRSAQDRIRVIQQELKPLESHPMFNPAIKVTDVPKQEKVVTTATEGNEELRFSLFEQADKAADRVDKKKEPKDIRNFDYTGRSWTGKSPKQFLIDWCRKNLPKSPAPSFQKVPSGRFWKCKVRIQRADDDVLEVCPTILTEDSMQAQHLGATLALYTLVKGQTSLCGYQIRAESRTSDSTCLLYCTTGVLLRKLQQDCLLTALTHVIVDEVHERSVQSDFLLTILRDLVQKRSDLQLLLMSATADCGKFASYFNHCPVLTIPGRTFPVQVYHLEDVVEATGYILDQDSEYSQRSVDEEEQVCISVTQKGGRTIQHQETIVRDTVPGWDLGLDLDHFSSRTRHALQYMNPNKVNMDLILDLLAYLDKATQFGTVDGAVLVFLPGLAHIQQLYGLLTTDKRFSSKDRYRLVALHSTLSSQDQAAAFKVPPAGVRKIVLSTNIAETGVTIPDVLFVIDTGKTKENRYHEGSQMSSLVETFVSKASALQRQGRAGRVRNGFCFRLYPKSKFDSFNEYSKPEILRVPLEELCLHIMKCEYGSPEDFLSRALDPPQQQSVCNAVSLLRKIGACHRESHTLTPLGHHLASLPVNVKIGKMLIFGAILGCLEPIATIAAAISEKSPFTTPMSRKEDANLAKDALAIANSDHLTIYHAYLRWQQARQEGVRSETAYCRKHFLSRTALITIENVKQELVRMVEQTGLSSALPIRPDGPRRRGEAQGPVSLSKRDIPVLVAVLTAGLYDSVGRVLTTPSVDPQERVVCTVETGQGKAQVHPSSINRSLHTPRWLLFQEKVKYAKVYLRDTTLVSPFPILLFGGDIDVQHRERLTTVDGWIHFQAPVRIGVIFKHLRKLMDSLLEQKLANPKMRLEDEKIIHLITELLQSESLPR
uniref:RNA helicase n=1 Tax=Electrophorus electricus TaxID=8005 RepID=A0A4W4H038_ELEEL